MKRNFKGLLLAFLIIQSVVLLNFTSCKNKSTEVETLKEIPLDGTNDISLDELNSRLRDDPQNPELLNSRAKLYIKMKKMQEAYQDIQMAIAIDSTKPEYQVTKADILFSVKKSGASKEALEAALDIDPDNKEANMKIAELYLFVKKYGLSLEHLDKVLIKDPNNPKAYFMKGINFKEMRDTAKAISSFQTCIEQDPHYYEAFIELGILFELQRNPLCINYYNNAIKTDPSKEEGWYGRAMFLQKNGKPEAALEDYRQILKINPKNKNAVYNQGYIYLVYLEQYDIAEGYFTTAVAIDPEYTEAWFNRGLSFELRGKIELAKSDYMQAVKIDPQFKPAKDRLASLK